MGDHIAFLLRGVGSGGVFAALAMALVVTYRSSGVVNLATGAIALYVAETYAYLRRGMLFNPIPGLPSKVKVASEMGLFPAGALSLLIAALLGVVLHLLVFRFLRAAPAVAKAVASIGVMIVLQSIIALRLGTNPITAAAILPTTTVKVFGQAIQADRLWFAACVVALAVLLTLLFRFTRFGLATRAAAESEKGAYVAGISPSRIALANAALSAVVAGVAGILIAPIVPIIPVSYTLFIVPALAAALVGGFTNLGPAVGAGLAIGMIQSELVFLQATHPSLPKAGMPEVVPLVFILFVLVVRGKPLPTRGAVVLRTLGRAPRPRNVWLPAVVWVPVALVALGLFHKGYRLGVIITLIYATIALSWVVCTGYAGQISLAQLSLAGVGAFSLHRFATNWGVPFPIAPLLAACVAAVIGVIIGLPALRIRGLPVAVVTLALAVALEAFWFLNPTFNGGLGGAKIAAPTMFGIHFRVDVSSSRLSFGVLCIVVLAAVALGVAVLRRSRLGSAMLAVKANERSAAAAGIDVARTKIIAFGIASFISGLGGALLAYQQGAAIPASYGAVLGLGLFTTVYLSGITSISGGVNAGVIASGGIVFVIVNKFVDVGTWYALVTGLLLIITVIRNPEGVTGELLAAIAKIRHRNRRDTPLPSFERAAHAHVDARPLGASPVLLSLTSVGVRYGAVMAVDDVSLDIEEGMIVGLIGPNGAGKTTLIDSIGGFAPSTGVVRFDGHELNALRPHERIRRGLGRTFQGIDLYEGLTVEENIVAGQEAARHRHHADGIGGAADLDRICEALHLEQVRHRQVKELSVGYRQLVSVGRALAGRPRLLLLDEPAGGLDSDESVWLGQRIRDVRDFGVTIVMIDHDMGLVLGVCDYVHVLDLGRIIASGPPDEIRSNAAVAAAYLGTTHAQPVAERGGVS